MCGVTDDTDVHVHVHVYGSRLRWKEARVVKRVCAEQWYRRQKRRILSSGPSFHRTREPYTCTCTCTSVHPLLLLLAPVVIVIAVVVVLRLRAQDLARDRIDLDLGFLAIDDQIEGVDQASVFLLDLRFGDAGAGILGQRRGGCLVGVLREVWRKRGVAD
jgi:hypothetical protein